MKSKYSQSNPMVRSLEINQDKDAHLLLSLRDRQLRTLFETTLDAIAIADDHGYYVDVNPAACELFGLTRDELLGRCIADFTIPGFNFSVAWQEFHEQEKLRGEFQLVRDDGELRFVEYAATANFLPHRHLSVMRDITDRKLAEAKAKELSLQLEAQILAYPALQLPGFQFPGFQSPTVQSPAVQSPKEQTPDLGDRLIAELGLEQFFSLSLDLLCVVDERGYFRRLSRSWQTILGYDLKELEGRLSLDFVHPEDFDSTIETMFDLSEQKPILEFTNRYLAKDGTYRYLEWRSMPYGNLVYAAARDVTDRQRAEAKLIETMQLQQAILDGADYLIISTDVQGIIKIFNPAAQENLGYTAEELVDKLSPAIFHDLEEVKQRAAELTLELGRRIPVGFEAFVAKASLGIVDENEWSYIRKDGSRFPVQLSVTALRNKENKITGFLGIAKNITDQKAALHEQKLAESALAESEARNRAMVQAIPDIMFRVDREGVYLSYDGFSALMSFSIRQSPIGRKMIDSIPEEVYLRHQHHINIALETRQVQVYEQDVVVDGKLQQEEVRVVPIEDKDEVLFIIRDIHERKQAENLLQQQRAELEATLQKLQSTQLQLIQSEKMSSLGQLVAGIAHEINNPVSFIYGNTHYATDYARSLIDLIRLYQEEYPTTSQVISERLEEVSIDYLASDFVSLLESMRNGATRIRDIVKSLRTFSRLDESSCKIIDIHENLDSTLIVLQGRFNGRAGKPEIQIIKNYGDLPRIECHSGLLNQVFVNLLMNAIDAIESRAANKAIEQQLDGLDLSQLAAYRGMITITTSLSSTNQTVICIQDNGCGMDAQTQAKMFDPFFTTKPVGQGTGMGLAISYQIITENHYGEISISSELDRGTDITITLPHLSLDCSRTLN